MEKILHIKQNSSSMFEAFYKKYTKNIYMHTHVITWEMTSIYGEVSAYHSILCWTLMQAVRY